MESTTTTVRVTADTWKRIKTIANADRRTVQATLEMIVEREVGRRQSTSKRRRVAV